jgi:hypothetical protein
VSAASFTFTVKVTGLDIDGWADEYGLDLNDAAKDFKNHITEELTEFLTQRLRRQGYTETAIETSAR